MVLLLPYMAKMDSDLSPPPPVYALGRLQDLVVSPRGMLPSLTAFGTGAILSSSACRPCTSPLLQEGGEAGLQGLIAVL